MKILFLCLYPIEYATSGMLGNLALVNGLLQLNHEVDYLTRNPNSNYVINQLLLESKNLRVYRLPSNAIYTWIVDQRDKTNTGLTKKLFQWGRELYHRLKIYDNSQQVARHANCDVLPSREYDVVISSSDPKSSHNAVYRLLKKGLKYSAWIQYWGDPMTLDITNRTLWPKLYIKQLEGRILKGANSIVYVSPFTWKEQKKLFSVYSNKMFFVPTAYMHTKQSQKRPKESSKDNYRIGYFGAYNSNTRNILPLYYTCKNLPNEVSLHIVGGSDIVLEEQSNIKIESRQESSVIEQYETECDLIVCIMNSNGSQIPGKIYHSAATNKPILVIIDGEYADDIKSYLEGFDRFIFSKNNEADIRNAILLVMNEERVWVPSPEFAPKIVAEKILRTIGCPSTIE